MRPLFRLVGARSYRDPVFCYSDPFLSLLSMRSLSFVQRVASLLLGCWLAVFVAEPVGMHSCPVHDGIGHGVAHAHHTPTPAPGQSEHHSCTCPGTCCPGARAQFAAAPTVAPARIVSFVEPDVVGFELVSSADAQLTLPPALGPPTASV